MTRFAYGFLVFTVVSFFTLWLIYQRSSEPDYERAYFLLPDGTKISLTPDSCNIDSIIAKIPPQKIEHMGPKEETQIIVPSGERYRIFIDSSAVTLKERTILSLFLGDYKDRYQKVKIEGDGYFSLAGDTIAKYFKILAGQTSIISSGGRLQVHTRGKDSCLVFAYASKINLENPAGSLNNYGPGAAVSIKSNHTIRKDLHVNDEAPLWAVDELKFEGMFVDLLNYAVIRYKIDVEADSEYMLGRLVNLRIKNGLSIEMFCEVVKNATGFDYKIKKNKVIFFSTESI